MPRRHTGQDIPTLLNAILQLLPLDETAPPAMVMGMVRACVRAWCIHTAHHEGESDTHHHHFTMQ